MHTHNGDCLLNNLKLTYNVLNKACIIANILQTSGITTVAMGCCSILAGRNCIFQPQESRTVANYNVKGL